MIGPELRRLMAAKGLSVRVLAWRSGVSRGYIGDLLTGRRGHRPSRAVIARLAAGLGVDIDAFGAVRRQRAVELFPEAVDELYRERRP